MPFGISDLVQIVLVPAAVAWIVFVVQRRLGRLGGPSRHAAAHAVLAGFFAGYLLLGWSRVRPVEHWEWLPWLAVLATVLGPTASASGVGRFDRVALRLVLGGVAAWALVPAWPALADVRLVHVAVLGAAIAATCLALEGLPERFTGAIVPALLCWSAFVAAGLLAHSGSLKFAELAGLTGAALGGCALGSWRRGLSTVPRPAGGRDGETRAEPAERDPAFRGGTDVFAVLIGGLVYAGWVHSFSAVPTVSYVVPAVAPACLWACAAGPLAKLTGAWKRAARVAVVVVPLAAALALAVWMEPLVE